MNLSRRAVFTSLLPLCFNGCTVGPQHTAPQPAMPAAWSVMGEGGINSQALEIAAWWKTLNDPALDSLIERAVLGNYDLRIAQSRVREARAQRGVVNAARLPTLDANGSYTRGRRSENEAGAGFGPVSRDTDLYQAGFDAGWEIDVFGGVRRLVEAADANIESAQFDRRDVLITLVAEVARNYVDLCSFQRRLAIAHNNIDSQQQTVEISQARFDAGIVSELDVAQAKAQLATTQSQVPALESLLKQSVHSLGLLLGLQPQALLDELSNPAPIPMTPPQVPVGLPSELLRRRPDIRRAERDLAASTALVGVATADLFPKFFLTGSLGVSSEDASNLFSAGSRTFGIGPSVTWPIFAGGRIRANIEVQNAREEQALASYEQTVLASLGDVENSLIAFWKEQTRRESLTEAVVANRRAVDLANELYSRGIGDFLRVLASQRALFLAEDELVLSDQAVTANYIALYKALGGGWEIYE